MRKLFIYLFFILLGFNAIGLKATSPPTAAQSAVIQGVTFDNYPCLKATYTVWDTLGNDMRVSNGNDIIITENGKVKTQCASSPFCGPPGDKSFSAIVCVDMSLSMLDPISTTDGQSRESAALAAIRGFILALPVFTNANGKKQLQNCEVAIMQFDGGAELITGFTDLEDSLVKMTATSKYNTRVFTDYNAAFYKDKWGNKTNTALDIANSARYKPVIIFITDGGHDANYATPADGSEPRDGRVMLQEIATICHTRRPTVYVFVFQIGTEVIDPVSQGYLTGLAGIETGTIGGQPAKNLYMHMTDAGVLSDIFANYIPAVCGQVGYPTPCQVLWKSDCNGTGPLMLNFPSYNNVSASFSFTIPDDVKPNLDVNPRNITFDEDIPTGNYDKTLVITAQKNSVDVDNPPFNSPDPRYKITNWGGKTPPFTLNKGESATITLEYSPTDSMCSSTTLNVLGSMCTGSNIDVQGRMSLFPATVDMGTQTINIPKDQTISNLFCNRWCVPVKVTKISFSGGDAASFKLVSTTTPPLPVTLQPGECLSGTIEFTPYSTGDKKSSIVVQADNPTLTADITGIGSGTAGIDSYDPIAFNLGCPAQAPKDTTFELKNTGPIPMTITSATFIGPDTSEFSLVSPIPFPTSMPANDSIAVTIRFTPHSAGTKTDTFEVVSSATNHQPSYKIIVQGTLDSINYEPGSYTMDLGTLCLGTNKDTLISIQNTGTKDLQVSAFNKPATVTLNPVLLPVTIGQTASFDLTYTPDVEGPINSTLVLTEANCSWQKTIALTGTVYDPKVTTVPPNVIVSSNTNVAT
ncbi:MAG: choice-of-anchor D domain-containing protein, partial [FCB group bacterium]